MKSNDKEHWYYNILKLLKLELTTPHGRINLAGIVLLAACVLLYSASDLVKRFISANTFRKDAETADASS